MGDRVEGLLREVQRQRAMQAPDPDRIRAALPFLAARRARRRRAGLVAGAGLAVLAVIAAVLLVPRPTVNRPMPATTTPSPSASASGVAPAMPDFEHTYAPGWLPPGFRESTRALASEPHLGLRAVRIWTKGDGSYLRVVTLTQRHWETGDLVQIGGVYGWYLGPKQGNRAAQLGWAAEPDRTVILESDPALPREDLLRVANSAAVDSGTTLRAPMRIPWAPGGATGYSYSYGGGPGAWTAMVEVGAMGDPPGAQVTVTLAPSTDVPDGGRVVEVGGVTGRLVVEEEPVDRNPRQCVVLPQPGGRVLSVCGFIAGPGGDRMPEADLLRAAASVDPTMRADTGWLG